MRSPYPIVAIAAVVALGGIAPDTASAQDAIESQLEVVLSRLSYEDRAAARLLVPTDDGFVVHRDGVGLFECTADKPGDQQFSVACYHQSLIPILEHGRKLVAEGLSGDAFRERQCADIENDLMLTMPRGAYWVTASTPLDDDGGLPARVTVYHFIQLPNVTREATGLPVSELSPGAPWLHNAATCDAHLMWAEERTLEPAVSGDG